MSWPRGDFLSSPGREVPLWCKLDTIAGGKRLPTIKWP